MGSKYRCTCEARVKFETRGHQRDATSNSIDEHTIEYWSPIPIPHSLQPAPPISCAVAVYVRIPRPHKFQTRQHAGQRALLPARLCSVAPKGQGESEKTRGEHFEPRTQSEGEGKHASKQGSVEARKHASKHASKIREGEVKHASKQAIK